MKAKIALVLLGLPLAALPAAAQQPVLDYTLTVNTNDYTSAVVAMRMRNLPDHFHLATVRHFLVDDRPWRFVDDLRLSSGTIAREQDGLWRVTGAGPDATLRYRVVFKRPEDPDEARKPFLTPSGGLIGDLHTFLYAVEAPEAPARVALELPLDWTIATTLSPTAESRTFFASNASELSDSPILAGKLRQWRFQFDQAPVHVDLPMHNESDFWAALKAAHIGDHLRLKVLRHETVQDLTVPVESYDALDAILRKVPDSIPSQKAIFTAWAEGS